jgi:hypothetical protein
VAIFVLLVEHSPLPSSMDNIQLPGFRTHWIIQIPYYPLSNPNQSITQMQIKRKGVTKTHKPSLQQPSDHAIPFLQDVSNSSSSSSIHKASLIFLFHHPTNLPRKIVDHLRL